MPIPALFGYDLENDSDLTGVNQIASELSFRLRAKGYAEQVPSPIPAMDTPLHYWYAKNEEKECKQNILYLTQNYLQIAFDVLPDLRRGRSVLLKPELFVEASDNL